MRVSQIELNCMCNDLSEIILKNKYEHIELYKYDEDNNIFIMRKEKAQELEVLVNDLKSYFSNNFVIKINNGGVEE